MDKISDIKIGEVVHVNCKNENGPVTRIHPPTMTVRLLTCEVEVREGEFEKRTLLS